MDKELVSIIVPIYNVEKYLKKCIESIINQTYKNIEIILVDDGSPDKCGEICEEYSKKDNRIVVIHKQNGGLSDARNKGIKVAKGKYITFVDSDDYVDYRYIELLYKAVKENNTKIAQCNIAKVNMSGNIIARLGYRENSIKTSKNMLNDIYSSHLIENIVVWNKLYLKEMFNNISFPVGKIHEDEFTTFKILYNVDKISIVNEYLYYYRQTDESIIGKKFNKKRMDLLEALEERISFLKEKKEYDLYKKTLKYYIEQLRVYFIKTKKYIGNSSKIQKTIKYKYKIACEEYLKLKEIPNKEKIKSLIFLVLPNIFYMIKKNKY